MSEVSSADQITRINDSTTTLTEGSINFVAYNLTSMSNRRNKVIGNQFKYDPSIWLLGCQEGFQPPDIGHRRLKRNIFWIIVFIVVMYFIVSSTLPALGDPMMSVKILFDAAVTLNLNHEFQNKTLSEVYIPEFILYNIFQPYRFMTPNSWIRCFNSVHRYWRYHCSRKLNHRTEIATMSNT